MDISLQLDRLETINSEIEQGIRTDKLDSIQPLLDERESRIGQLLETQKTVGAEKFSHYIDRLRSINEGGDELSRLMELKLKVISNEMRKTSDAQTISKGYTKGSTVLAKEFRRSTDITG